MSYSEYHGKGEGVIVSSRRSYRIIHFLAYKILKDTLYYAPVHDQLYCSAYMAIAFKTTTAAVAELKLLLDITHS